MQDKPQASSQQPFDSCELKIDKITYEDLKRNDLVFHENDIWRCESLNLRIFQNLETKQQTKIPSQQNQLKDHPFFRIEKLELIPKQWKHLETTTENPGQPQIILKGQQLGLGPLHQIQVVGMRRFEELQVVKSQKMKGRNIPFKVILCKTKKPKCYLIGAIDFLD